ncbi:MAG TPA: outer membrane beta-barrel protein [Spirochaetota bacterium]
MKRLTLVITALIAISAISAAHAQEFIFDAKAGVARAKDPAKLGFNANIETGVGVNPYLALLVIPGFTWFSWDKGTGITKTEGPIQSELKANIDAYCYPVFGAAKIRIPDLKESIGIEPYVTVGAGYMWMRYKYSSPAYTDTSGTAHPSSSISSTYKGFAWQAVAGFGYKLPDTSMSLILEGGYRGAKLKKNSFEVDMSGFIASAGVSFSLSGNND